MQETTTNPEAGSAADTSEWAIIELMGHVRYGGRISQDNKFGTAMLRVDVPQTDGSFVSQLINPASIYRITLTDETLARAAARQGQSKPMEPWETRHLVPTLGAVGAEDDYQDDEEFGDHS